MKNLTIKKLTKISILAITTAITACDKTPASSLLTFEPPSLAACDPSAEVTVKWDVRNAHPEVNNVQVFVTVGVSEDLFAEGVAWGDAKTGPWVIPGKPRFVLKDKADGKVLGEAAIAGPKCN